MIGGTNVPLGSAYNKAFGQWLDEHRWARQLDKATRNHAIWAADNRDAVKRWRETLAQNVRARLNHPTAVKRRFDAANKAREASAPGRLLRGHEPHGAALAGAGTQHRLRIGRADLVEGQEPITCGRGARAERERHLE